MEDETKRVEAGLQRLRLWTFAMSVAALVKAQVPFGSKPIPTVV